MDSSIVLQFNHENLEEDKKNLENEVDTLKNQDHVYDPQENLENMIRSFKAYIYDEYKGSKARVKSIKRNKHYVEKRKEEGLGFSHQQGIIFLNKETQAGLGSKD
ncbi:hypothetical protein HAX54_010896 [Datura stramonium]|uniref:Uncharacterized protein n=1 Tax=Datura stramonium TaxID=4076 RepID=A0ABS8TJR2_DATST|nr:hypothetical protein [Datura stramonium]